MAAITAAKIGKLGGVWGAASPPIIAPPTGIGPKTISGVTGAGIAGRLILNKENASSGVLKAGGVGGDNPISKPRSPGAQLSIELPPANSQEELPKVE